MTRQLSIITGCSAGATESFVVVPFELVKIKCAPSPFALTYRYLLTAKHFSRLQDKSLASTYNGPIDVVRQIVRKDGVLGLYAGMEATFWRCVNLPWRCSMYGSTSPEGTCGGMAATLDPSSRSSRCFPKLRYKQYDTRSTYCETSKYAFRLPRENS